MQSRRNSNPRMAPGQVPGQAPRASRGRSFVSVRTASSGRERRTSINTHDRADTTIALTQTQKAEMAVAIIASLTIRSRPSHKDASWSSLSQAIGDCLHSSASSASSPQGPRRFSRHFNILGLNMNFRALLDLVFTRSFWSLETMGKFSFALLQGFFIFILSFLIILPRMLVLILAGVLYFLPECIFRCLPTIATTPVRQSRRYVTKIGQGAEQRIEMRLAATKKDRGSGEAVIVTYRGGLGQKCPLSEFLSVYDILLLVTQDLHYVDIENLGRVSRGVREAVMPQQSIHHRMNVFRKYTCQTPDRESSIAECWVCYKQSPRLDHFFTWRTVRHTVEAATIAAS
ncbi:hypothetical protein T440DRAFT_478498 [Plenodomus tracheiphilus IPT5]|uniref:Uncharacterized protein n=1 Tax=Plenodomus tracheiphilus IPT5 TaxID=1408161 RepID=A0A6A7B9S6_9PLEO|nr:hypothetical protein T440DRAFT_478498 [Plenodomus tracheiphilus IPT5]